MKALKRLFGDLLLSLASAMAMIGLQMGLGNVKAALEAARKLDQAYSGAATAPAPEHQAIMTTPALDEPGEEELPWQPADDVGADDDVD